MKNPQNIISKAVHDKNFCRELVSNPKQALRKAGFNPPKDWTIKVIEEQNEKTFTFSIPKTMSEKDELDVIELQRVVGGVGVGVEVEKDPHHS